MTNKFELYKCNICGNIIEVLISGDGHPVCCGEEMHKLEVQNDNKNSSMLTEKHVPKIEFNDNQNIFITVSNHPMEEKHYIMFLQTISNNNNESRTIFFYPGQDVSMNVVSKNNDIKARSYCNIHGLYVSD